MLKRPTRGWSALVLSCGLIAAACGGGGASDPGKNATGGDASPTGGSDSGGTTTIGAPTLEADAGQAWAEVDGERFEYEPADSLSYECSIADDQIVVNFQTAGGHDLLVQGSRISGALNVTTNFTDDGKTVYGGILTRTAKGKLGLGDSELSYEGPVNRTSRSDPTNTKSVDAKIAVNCNASGDDPTVTVGGKKFSVAFAGAQSVTCDVAPGDVDIIVNRLASDNLQIQVSARTETSGLVGSVGVITEDGSYSASIPRDGEGFVVDGDTVTFTGSFTTPAGETVAGTAEVTCP